jgi:hypothetical protein
MDLVDMSKYNDKNKGYRWILTSIEILSRYAFTVPVHRKNATTMKDAVSNCLEQFRNHFGKYPKFVQFDQGTEFYNKEVKSLLNKHNIEFFSTYSEEQKSYPQYDDMSYHDLLSNFDELTNRLQKEAKYGSDPLIITDLNSELNYVKQLMEERGTAQTTFTEGGDGTVNISGPAGSTTVPSVDFVEDPNNLLPDVLDAFD